METEKETDKITEAAQFARKLYQAVLTLDPSEIQPAPQVHRMAKALAEIMAARTQQPAAH